jgi:hypothetical protein
MLYVSFPQAMDLLRWSLRGARKRDAAIFTQQGNARALSSLIPNAHPLVILVAVKISTAIVHCELCIVLSFRAKSRNIPPIKNYE